MSNVKVDFSRAVGKMKPMHSVNNGPVYKFKEDQRITNIDAYRDAGIPYARTHDSSIYYDYGGEHIVDVNMIFTDFDADPYDPASYDFTLTDEYLRVIIHGGAKPFYRLGSKIEHWSKKYNTLPPKDFHKWAVVCEHIIKHYNYGWADGFHMNIEYWEIWNEPDLDRDDSEHKRCWGSTAKMFYELFDVAFKHLKATFPELKIGGPAVAKFSAEWLGGFFETLDCKPDFFSWHIYGNDVSKIRERIRIFRKLLDDNGLTETESILNEWNYVRGWKDDDWIYSLKQMKSNKGAQFVAATMLMSQKEPLDNLMYYDARPCRMNGLFNTDFVNETLKGYYPFYMFNRLYKQGTEVVSESDDGDVWVCAAKGEEQNVMLTYFNDDDTLPKKQVDISLENVETDGEVILEYYLLDQTHDAELVHTQTVTSGHTEVSVTMPLNSTYLLKIVNL